MPRHLSVVAVLILALALAACSNDTAPDRTTSTSAISGPAFDVLPPGQACMGDLIWNDLNMNGIQDDGEPGLGGVTVRLFECPSGVLVDETTSEADGYYALFGPENDDYYIVVTAPDGWAFSPSNQGADDTIDSDVDGSGYGFCTNLHTAEIEKDMDAGLYMDSTPKLGQIGDWVWFDADCDGIQYETDKGVAGVTVNLYACKGGLVATTLTDGGGFYCFTDLPAGDYTVEFIAPAGFELAPQNQGGDDALDSDADPATGRSDCITLAAGESNKTVDAGLCEGKKEEGGAGCTPGYWKNNLVAWDDTGFSTGDYFDDVFGCGPHITLAEALTLKGGGFKALYRHAVAAILNASHPDVSYDMSVGEITAAVCGVGDDPEPLKNMLDDLNNQGCTINAHGEAVIDD